MVDLSLAKTGATTELSWAEVMGATGYDVVKGTVSMLLSSGGDFTAAATSCMASNQAGTTVNDGDTPGSADGFWYVVRGKNCGGSGSYDSGSRTQHGSRDSEIAASEGACP